LRDAVAAIQSDVIAFQLRLSQSKPIYDALVRLRQNLSANDTIRARVLDVAIRDAKHDGVGLSGDSKVRFNQLAQQMSNIARQFSHNVLDATKALTYVLRDKADVANLPASLIAQGANAAKAAGLCAEANPTDGPWQFTLDPASYQSLMTYSSSREWRQRYYEDMQKRAAPAESDLVTKSYAQHQCRTDASATPTDAKITDNGILLHQMLAARSELASLLGYTDYAHVSCASKMTEKPSVAFDMLNRLQQVAAPAARAEFSELEAFARAHGGPHELRAWDVPFWAERQRQALYDFSAEELRAYFPLPRVLEGLFELLSRLFGVRIAAADGLAPVWADGVSLFAVYNVDGTDPIAYLFVDPYARPANKRGGAWMSSCSQRTIDRLPVAHIVCNQAPPLPASKEHPSGRPSLMTFREVETLFHEFGHALQHILTTQIGLFPMRLVRVVREI
jgi:oligopeptidase A